MADYETLLRDHVTLTCRSVDRIFLQGYVPKLQSVGLVCIFLRWVRGFFIPSSAASVLIGIAQEKASVWRSWPAKGHEKAKHPHMEWGCCPTRSMNTAPTSWVETGSGRAGVVGRRCRPFSAL